MKKKLLYTCIAASFALSLGSCSDVMDVTPDGRLSLEEVFANPDYTAAYFSQAFDNLPHKMMNYYWFDNLPSALSDESWSCDDVEGVGAINAYKGQGSARENLFETCYNENFECQYWERYWKSIRTINVFLQNIPTAAVNSETGTCIAGLLLLAVDKMVWSASHNKSPFPGRCRLLDRKKELGRRLPQVCRRRLRDGYAVRRPAVAYSERPGIQAPDPRHGCSYPFPSCSVCRKPAV